MVDRDPGRAAGRRKQRIQESPIGNRVAAVLHRFGLAIRARHRSRVEVIAADHDRRLELALRDHLVEREARLVALAQAEPADARGQPLELDAAARHLEPLREMLVLREERLHLRIRLEDVLGIAGERDPAERSLAFAEERADIRRNESGIRERIGHTFVLRDLADVVAVVERRHDLPHGAD